MIVPVVALALAAPVAETSAAAAVRIVERYYAAVERRDYAAARAIWSGGRSLAAIRRGYAHTAHVEVVPIPPFTTEGGAGSIYAEIRVRVIARLDDGRRQHFAGSFTLRRVNDVDGSTAAQRRWHIVGAHLREMPAGG